MRFVTGDPGEDEEDDVIWWSSEGGWDSPELGPRLLASHRLARNPDAEELDNLTAAIEHNIEDGQGLGVSASEIDDWLAGFYEGDEEVD